MMMNKLKLLQLAAIIAAIVFCFAACGGDGGNPPPEDQTPVAGDFTIGNLSQVKGNVTAVTITPKEGKSGGTITIKYAGSATLPSESESGKTYAVTFDVAAAGGWKAVDGLSAGTLSIYDGIFTDAADLKDYLDNAEENTKGTPYYIALNVDDLGGYYNASGSVGDALYTNSNKYVSLDLSGSTLTEIVDGAFRDCTSLASVTIPNSVTGIGAVAFYNCTSLASVTIPNSVTSIGANAFNNTLWLDNQPDGMVYAGKVAYLYKGDKSAVTTATISDGTKGIGSYAFSGCTNLVTITIPDSVTIIGSSAFSSCASLESITIPNSVTNIGSSAFWYCTSLESVTIPNSVTSIGSSAFSVCASLESVTIPNSVTSIGVQAFWSCSGLKSVTFEGAVTTLASNAFDNVGDLNTVLESGGTPGTYVCTSGSGGSGVWAKQ